MQKGYRGIVIALALLGSVGLANAAQLNLTAAQKQTIYRSVMNEKGQPAPAGFQAKVGATAPQSLSLHMLPTNLSSEVPAVKDYPYAKLQNNEILLVNPKDRQVAEIITQQGTVGQQGGAGQSK
jgi:hypothetical protein